MQLAGDSSALLVLNAEQTPAEFAQSFFCISPRGYIYHYDAELREYPPALADGEVVHQPVSRFARPGWQVGRKLSIEHRFSGAQDLLQQKIGMHATLAKHF